MTKGFDGAMGLKEGGGGRVKPDNGGVAVCRRDGGREVEEVDEAGSDTLEGPAPGVADGVIGRDGASGGGNMGSDVCKPAPEGAALDGAASLLGSRGPNNAAKSSLARLLWVPGESGLLAALVGLGAGARGGGANGGGKTGAIDSRLALTNFSNASAESSSASSLALGTISERNSMSSEERARELRGLLPIVLPRRENRLRKRDTAEGAGGVSERSGTVSGAEP